MQDIELYARFTLRRPGRPKGLYWQLRWFAGSVLRKLESLGILRSVPWPVSLKHSSTNANAKPVLIWALGAERHELRRACLSLTVLLRERPNIAPVLITDVADFAFFSRLDWLVEYVPQIRGVGESYEQRKIGHLARLYRDACALPISLGLESREDAQRMFFRHT